MILVEIVNASYNGAKIYCDLKVRDLERMLRDGATPDEFVSGCMAASGSLFPKDWGDRASVFFSQSYTRLVFYYEHTEELPLVWHWEKVNTQK